MTARRWSGPLRVALGGVACLVAASCAGKSVFSSRGTGAHGTGGSAMGGATATGGTSSGGGNQGGGSGVTAFGGTGATGAVAGSFVTDGGETFWGGSAGVTTGGAGSAAAGASGATGGSAGSWGTAGAEPFGGGAGLGEGGSGTHDECTGPLRDGVAAYADRHLERLRGVTELDGPLEIHDGLASWRGCAICPRPMGSQSANVRRSPLSTAWKTWCPSKSSGYNGSQSAICTGSTGSGPFRTRSGFRQTRSSRPSRVSRA